MDWIEAADPGALRRRHAARAALAALTAWLIMRLGNALFADRPMPSVGIFAVTVCFISSLVVADASRRERQLTLGLSVTAFAVALVLASAIGRMEWLYFIVLLGLMFLSYAARRRGLRQGELALLLTMGLYFAVNSRVTWVNLVWFLLAAMVGVVSLWLWQFVLLPYDPARSLRDCVRAFYDRAAEVVDVIGNGVEAPSAFPDQAAWAKGLKARLKRIKFSRRVIESQFPGVLAPGGWTAGRIGQLQVTLYAAEQGLAQMIEGASDRDALVHILSDFRAPLTRSLRSLREALRAGSAESMQALVNEGAALKAKVQASASAAFGEGRDNMDAPLAPWAVASLRLVSGSVQVGKSIGQARALFVQAENATGAAAVQPAGAQLGPGVGQPNNPGGPALVRVLGRLNLHPTTVLGLQAVTATGLAMVVARLLGVDHSNWVFWTAFVVIAGSAGDSLRKMMLRVVGTVGGAVVGVLLALLAPDDTVLIVLVATACIFLTIYFSSVSYPQMVFWLNIGFVMVFTRLGADELDLLVNRPVTTLLGALVAALVVVFVFPIRVTDRFKAAAARFLEAVNGCVAAFVATVTADEGAQALEAAQAKAAAAYAQLEQTLPGIQFENNPLQQSASPLSEQATQMAALDADVARLAQAASERSGPASDADATLIRTVRDRIHQDIQAAIAHLHGERDKGARAPAGAQGQTATPALSSAVRSWAFAQSRPADEAQPDDEQGILRTDGGLALIRIQRTVKQLAADVRASGAAIPFTTKFSSSTSGGQI